MNEKNRYYGAGAGYSVFVFALASGLSNAADWQMPGPVVLDYLLRADSETAGLLKAATE